MRFYKSTHCSLMLSTLCLGVNAVRQGLGTCQQLLCVRVQRTFRYFFKTVSDSFFVVVGFWDLWKTVRVCVGGKMFE